LGYFLILIRSSFLKGIGLAILWPQFPTMAGIAVVLLTLCILPFRKSLE
jgi:ABC-2 type transport system permease protein